jgi:nucleoside-diphosphate-sugar epimerase
MRVFITGATGFIGSAVVKELIDAGHKVLGLTRTDEGARQLIAAGAEPHRGTLQDLPSLRSGAASVDGVIHLAFMHEFTDATLAARVGVMFRGLTGRGLMQSFMKVLSDTDKDAIDTLASALIGSGKPLVLTVGTMGMKAGIMATETAAPDPQSAGAMRSVPSEKAVADYAAQGVRTSVVRLPPSVHGDGDQGFVPRLYSIAKKKGFSAYVGDGGNRWPAVHRLDAARLYRLALENGQAGSIFQGIADEGVPFREIAEVIARQLHVPARSITPKAAESHFSWLGRFVATDNPANSKITRQQLSWHPTETALLPDIDRASYFKA